MNVKIVKKPAFSFYGIKRNFSTVGGENFREIPMFWEEVMRDESFQEMIIHAKGDCVGACMPMNSETTFDYIIGAIGDFRSEKYEQHSVPEGRWAVLEIVGKLSETIGPGWQYMMNEWLPESGETHDVRPEFEIYPGGDPDGPDYRMEIWIPIK